jgi:four helix bundle protein
MSGTFEDLQAWRLTMDLATEVYRCTQLFPKVELYRLTDQMRRSAVSIPSNIAEGKGRSSDRELLQFLNHARGSLYELQTQIKLVARFSYLAGDTADKIGLQAAEVGKVLNGLIRNFRKISTLGSETRA